MEGLFFHFCNQITMKYFMRCGFILYPTIHQIQKEHH